MKRATLITGLVYEIVPLASGQEYVEYVVHHGVLPVTHVQDSDSVLLTGSVQSRAVPVSRVCFSDERPDLYVAYSEEVERLLGAPIRAIRERAAAAEAKAADNATKFSILLDAARELANLGWRDRLRFLFKLYELKHKPPEGVRL